MSKTPGTYAPRHQFAGAVLITAILAMLASLILVNAEASESPLAMGTASTYGVLANTAVTSATPSGITGTAGSDIGVGNATAPTGTISPAGTVVLGGTSITALSDATAALGDNRGGTVTGVELGGTTKTPGAYTNPTLGITGTLTLDGLGDASSVFIFRADTTLITAASSSVVLTNGAQACNVFWQVGSSATLGASSTMVGHVIAYASISTGTSTTIQGQLIATTGAVTLGGSTIQNNSCVTPTPTPTSTSTPAEQAPSVWSTFFAGCLDETGNPPDGIGVPAGSNVSLILPANIGSVANPAKAEPLSRTGYRFLGWGTSSSSTTVLTSPFTPTGNSTLCAVWQKLPTPVVTPTASVEATPTPEATVEATVTPTPEAPVEATPTPEATVEATATPSPITTTESGGLLPTTSTPWINLLLIGGILIALGALVFGARKYVIR